MALAPSLIWWRVSRRRTTERGLSAIGLSIVFSRFCSDVLVCSSEASSYAGAAVGAPAVAY